MTTKSSIPGLIAAAFLGVALSFALGANTAKAPAVPKYSLQLSGPFLHITDNDTNRVYIYLNEKEGSKLLGTMDLNDTGKPEIKAMKAGDGK